MPFLKSLHGPADLPTEGLMNVKTPYAPPSAAQPAAVTPRPEPLPIEFLGDVPLAVTVEFGTATITIRRYLQFRVGSILELGKLAGEPMEIRANGTLLGKGEVVVVNERYGVRVTEIAEPKE